MYHHYDQLAQSKHVDIAHITGISRDLFSEYDILALNDLLLSNGMHTIKVQNNLIGRKILDMFLTLLNYYEHIYWLSAHHRQDKAGLYDLYDALKQYGCCESSSLELYEAYFYGEFHGDCLIIEHDDQLVKEKWYTDVLQALCQSHICDRMPVVQLLSEKSS